jgi:hypothetical protein
MLSFLPLRTPRLSGVLDMRLGCSAHVPRVKRPLAGVAARCGDCWGGALSIGGFSEDDTPGRSTAFVRAGHSNSGFFFNHSVWQLLNASAAHMVRLASTRRRARRRTTTARSGLSQTRMRR